MPLIFTDEQIKNMSKETIELPLLIDNPAEGTGLVQQQELLVIQKDLVYATDQQNKIFSDFWIGINQAYHDEYSYLNGVLRTTYADSDLVLGGQQLSPHYTSSWPNLGPILLDSNKGNPTSGSTTEASLITPVSDAVAWLVSGFTSGATSTTLSNAYSAGSGFIEITAGTLSNGDTVLIQNGSAFILGTAGATTGFCTPTATPDTEAQCAIEGGTWTETIGFTPISPDQAMPSGSTVANFHSGFTTAQRGYQSWGGNDYQTYLENKIITETNTYEAHITSQKTALDGNEELDATRKALNDSEITNLQTALDDIATWEGLVVIDVNGKYTDTGIATLNGVLSTRTTRIPIRTSEVESNLGTPVQAGDGSVSGAGAYLNLWEWVLIRISRSGGTLTAWYGADLGIKHFQLKIENAEATLAQYSATFAIAQILSDTTIGQIAFEVDDVSEFSNGQTVKVMENDSVVYTRTIDDITGPIITLDSGIPAILTTSGLARIVRSK